jgi:hypothetical protein
VYRYHFFIHEVLRRWRSSDIIDVTIKLYIYSNVHAEAREELASFLSRYSDAWPVKLYIEHYLSKKTYTKRHAFRAKMEKLRPAPKAFRIKISASEVKYLSSMV